MVLWFILWRFFLGPNDHSPGQEVDSLKASLSINIQESQMQQKWLVFVDI